MIESDGKETSATHMAYLSMHEMILTGVLPAGQKLKIEHLRKMLDMGTSPVREALSLLTSDMLVERIDQRGFRTAPASLANFKDILDVRCALEDMAIRRSIALASPEWEDKVVLSHHRMKRATERSLFEDAHKAFHMALLSNAGSPVLVRYCGQLYDLNIRYRYLAAAGAGYQRRDISAEHTEILEAAIERDAEATSKALLNHYRLTGAYLTTQLSDL